MTDTKAQTTPKVPAGATQGGEVLKDTNNNWMEACVWTERMVLALVNGVKGGRWFSLMDKVFAPATLEAAWEKVWANDGAAGVDRQSIERFEAQEEIYLKELSTALREGSYRPQPVRRVEIPKGDGRTRPLGIPTVKDSIVQTAVKFVLEPIFEATPQGAVISPLLSNIYLHPLDELMAACDYRMVRYADDFVVLCKSREEAEAALVRIRAWVKDNGLRLHPDKTHIGDCRKRGEGFEFLGYRFEAGGRYVRKKSLDRLKDSIRAKTRRTCGQSLARIIESLNRTLRGWFNYFKQAHPNTFPAVDQFVRRRLRAILRKQEKRPGFGKALNDHLRWPNAFFAEAGLLALKTAHQNAKHSR